MNLFQITIYGSFRYGVDNSGVIFGTTWDLYKLWGVPWKHEYCYMQKSTLFEEREQWWIL